VQGAAAELALGPTQSHARSPGKVLGDRMGNHGDAALGSDYTVVMLAGGVIAICDRASCPSIVSIPGRATRPREFIQHQHQQKQRGKEEKRNVVSRYAYAMTSRLYMAACSVRVQLRYAVIFHNRKQKKKKKLVHLRNTSMYEEQNKKT
jgi:hypothetical protein